MICDVLLICHPATCSNHFENLFAQKCFLSFSPKLNSNHTNPTLENFLKVVPSHLLQDFTSLLHPMLASPPFNICTKGGQANSDFELHLQGISQRYQATSNLHKFPMKRKGGIHTQQICYACGEAQHVALQCQSPKIANLDHLKKKACRRCGEEGHPASQCPGNCPNCEDKHPLGGCPTSHITCFQCESSTHVPANCPINYLVSAISKIQPNNFQLAAHVV
jgi:hypothetical protein